MEKIREMLVRKALRLSKTGKTEQEKSNDLEYSLKLNFFPGMKVVIFGKYDYNAHGRFRIVRVFDGLSRSAAETGGELYRKRTSAADGRKDPGIRVKGRVRACRP